MAKTNKELYELIKQKKNEGVSFEDFIKLEEIEDLSAVRTMWFFNEQQQSQQSQEDYEIEWKLLSKAPILLFSGSKINPNGDRQENCFVKSYLFDSEDKIENLFVNDGKHIVSECFIDENNFTYQNEKNEQLCVKEGEIVSYFSNAISFIDGKLSVFGSYIGECTFSSISKTIKDSDNVFCVLIADKINEYLSFKTKKSVLALFANRASREELLNE